MSHGVARSPYDHVVDPNTARHVLRLAPDAQLDADMIEAAHAREAFARHPTRYPDLEGRRAAESWALTLAEARSTLLRSIGTTDAATWTPPAMPPRVAPGPSVSPGWTAGGPRTPPPWVGPTDGAASGLAPSPRRRHGLILGIVAASIAVLAIFVGAGIGAAWLAGQLSERASAVEDPAEPGPTADVERYSADEASFTFPAAMEQYYDLRYADRCPAEFTSGCWETAVITESSCASLQVDLEFTNDGDDWIVQARETIAAADVAAGDITPVVFGHDGYDYGWIADVRCADGAASVEPATNARAVSTPLARLEAGQWAFEDTGFWFLASLEVYDDDRLGSCPPEFERGCWQAAIVPEASCDRLTVQYSFTNGTTSELKQSFTRADVVPGEPVEIVFGNDDYDYGWISLVSC